MDDFAISISVFAAEQAASVYESTAEQVTTLMDVDVEHVSRVSLEDWTQAHAEGLDGLSDPKCRCLVCWEGF